ncbi:MAG: poly-beta-1,6-N-acetyl-D-glucosamine N-deacetylase PgaB [Gammaproteobacteria bacterium]
MLLRLLLALLVLSCASPAFAGRAEEPSLTVISYHEIVEPKDALIPSYAVSPTMFVRHIDWLRNNGFHFVSVDQVIAAQQGGHPLPPKAVLLTFDDGYTSVATHAWPMLQMLRIPSVLAVVTSWQEASESVNFDGKIIPRNTFLSWEQLRTMQASGLVEIASHSHDLHRGVSGNPQGNLLPATTTRVFDSSSHQYESESAFKRRLTSDLERSASLIAKRTGRKPRVIVWPYGKYNVIAEEAARSAGMVLGLTLEDSGNSSSVSPLRLRRILMDRTMDIGDLRYAINVRNAGLTENDRPQKIAHVDLDFIYDEDVAQQERNLAHLLDRLSWLGVNTVYLQAFSDPDANGSASEVYFPNRHVPMRADLFNRVAWQIRTRTPVRRVYAWMPLLAWELPKNHPVAAQTVKALAGASKASVNMGYLRLSPFSGEARQVVHEIFEDLSRYTAFDGIIYHDDITLNDFEDDSAYARATYRQWGLPDSVEAIRANEDLVGRWTILKINFLDELARETSEIVRREKPALFTARNLYAQVALNPRSETWYSQALENSLRHYDFTAIMAMPYMEGAVDPMQFQRDLFAAVERFPEGRRKVVFELQSVDWRHDQRPIPTRELVESIEMLYGLGALHVGYYPDMLFDSHPDPASMRRVFSLRSNDAELVSP